MSQRPSTPKINILAVAFIYFALFLVSVWIDHYQRLFRFPNKNEFTFARMATDVLIGFGSGLLVAGITSLATRYIKAFRDLSQSFYEFIGPLTRQEIFFLAVFSAIGEEFFFRGFLQGKVGLIAASLIFGLIHIGPDRRFILWTIFAIVLGFLLGGLYAWRGNLLTPVIVHFVVNLLSLTKLTVLEDQKDST